MVLKDVFLKLVYLYLYLYEGFLFELVFNLPIVNATQPCAGYNIPLLPSFTAVPINYLTDPV